MINLIIGICAFIGLVYTTYIITCIITGIIKTIKELMFIADNFGRTTNILRTQIEELEDKVNKLTKE